MLKLRILTAIVLIPIVLLAVFYLPSTAFSIACGIVILLAAWEWACLIGVKEYWLKLCYLATIVFLYILAQQIPFVWVLLLGVLWWICAALWILIYPRGRGIWQSKLVRGIIGCLLLLPTWVGLVTIQGDFSHLGPWYLLFMLLIIWAMDSGAYFSGRLWGKSPLAPKISPKKTIQGLYGGLLLVFLVALVFIFAFHLHWHKALVILFVALLSAVVSVIGDLVESMFKRYQEVKDSGTLLPGHGGILDRIDSLLAVVPLFALIITLIELKGLPFLS